MVLQIDNSDQLDLLFDLVSEQISYSRHFFSSSELFDDSELDNIRKDLKELRVLYGRLEDLKYDNKEG